LHTPFAAGAFALAVTLLSPARAAASEPLSIGVRVYDGFGVTDAELVEAAANVERIARRAGFELRWRQCREAGPDSCVDPLTREDVVIRLMAAPLPDAAVAKTGRLPLGYSVLVPPPERSRFATVYPDRVRTLAARAGTAAGAPLGFAIAHEVGHLLLSTAAHASRGLMRAHWSAKDVRTGRHADWDLLPQQRLAIAAAIAPPPAVGPADHPGGNAGGRAARPRGHAAH
jgi:hypothetical protein